MAIVPSRLQDLINFGILHGSIFVENSAAIGLSSAQATAFKNAAGDLEGLFIEALQARAAARSATGAQNTAAADFRRLAADTILLIKAFAENQPSPDGVYQLADLPPPAKPTPLPPPAQPMMITATLDGTGAITLRWKATNPPGGAVAYIVERRLAISGPGSVWDFAGIATQGRVFTDEAIPAGSTYIQYRITGQRGPVSGTPSVPFPVAFGPAPGGGGMMITSQGEGAEKAAGKKAA
jgi:hypothetical protein